MCTPAPARAAEGSYHASRANVDGHGQVGAYPSAAVAVAGAQRLQRAADRRGNHHGCRYRAEHRRATRDRRGNVVSHGAYRLRSHRPGADDEAGPWYVVEVRDPLALGIRGRAEEAVVAEHATLPAAEDACAGLRRTYRALGGPGAPSSRVSRARPAPAAPLPAYNPADCEPLGED